METEMDTEVLTQETKEILTEEREELVKLIEALQTLDKSVEWHVLKEIVFDRAKARIEKNILHESTSPHVDVNKIYRLQGELGWAQRYCDLNAFVGSLKRKLATINNKIQ